MHRIIKGAIIAATSLVAIGAGSAAHASVTIDTAGKGFVGKGDVQTALGYNNGAQMQANAKSLEVHHVAGRDPGRDAGCHAVGHADRHAVGVQYGVETRQAERRRRS